MAGMLGNPQLGARVVPVSGLPVMAARPSRPQALPKRAGGRGYLRAADGSSFCTLADGVVVQMIYCTNNGRLLTKVVRSI